MMPLRLVQSLEGVLTLPNDTRYGPWASTALTADEKQGLIYAIGTNGVYTNYTLSINADTFRLIPTNQDLYCVDFRSADSLHSQVLKLPKDWFTNYINDILILQAGEAADLPTLFIVHWNGSTFVTRSVSLGNFFPSTDFFEKVSFAPITIPSP